MLEEGICKRSICRETGDSRRVSRSAAGKDVNRAARRPVIWREWRGGEKVKKQAACAMWVKLTLVLPGGRRSLLSLAVQPAPRLRGNRLNGNFDRFNAEPIWRCWCLNALPRIPFPRCRHLLRNGSTSSRYTRCKTTARPHLAVYPKSRVSEAGLEI